MDASKQQLTATLEVPVIIPPELEELVKDLSALQTELRREIEFYRTKGDRKIYSEREAAEFFGISVKSMRQLRNDGMINFTPVKGQFFYTRENFEEFVIREQAGFKKRK